MISRKEYEEWYGKITDEEWANIIAQVSLICDRIWEEDHPLDD